MVVALMLGRGGSTGFPGKNTHSVLGRPLMEYALLAARYTPEIDEIYVSTDSDEIKTIGRKNGAYIIDRPAYLCTKDAKHQDAMIHGYEYIKGLGKDVELIILLQCNAPFILPKQLSEGVQVLRQRPEFDSAATVSEYSAFTPARARLIGKDRKILNFLSQEQMNGANSERDSQGKIYFTDGTFIVRPKCLEEIETGMLPYPWMGQKAYAIANWGGLDVDAAWQLPQVEYWLRAEGFTEDCLPYECGSGSNHDKQYESAQAAEVFI